MRLNLFSKVSTQCKIFIFFSLAGLLTTCTTYNSGQQTINNGKQNVPLSNRYALPGQVAPPPEIQSIQLYPTKDETAPPVIHLGSRQQLTLEFDYLDAGIRQFKLIVSHQTKNWEESPISPAIYLESFSETYFGDGQKSVVQNPTYHHYSYRFPNERLNITKSGNYLLSVFDYDSNKLLFRIPFFVSENKGTLDTQIKTLFAQRNDGHSIAQPFSAYRYPAFVQHPQFDLSFFYVQNQFWGRAQESKRFDTATPGVVNSHLSHDKSFVANYEFNLLDIRSFEPDGQQIVDIQPGQTPPLVTLRRDIQRFDSRPSPYPGSFPLGLPRDDRQAKYGLIEFSFEPASTIPAKAQLYLLGDFNNWMIDQRLRMRVDSTASLWKGHALIKQGNYRYKYVLIQENQIDDLSLDQMFTRSRQQYMTLVYFRDPQRNFDRLLKIDITNN